MNIKQIKTFSLLVAIVISSIAGVFSLNQSASAYTCPGKTTGGAAYYYKNGTCYEPNYSTSTYSATPKTIPNCPVTGDGSNCKSYSCPDGGTPSGQTCTKYTRNEADDAPTNKTEPVHDNGTKVTEWVCSEGKYENGGCASGYKMTKGEDTTTKPTSATSYCAKTYVSQGNDNQSANRQACEAGLSGKDCNTYSGAQKTSCEAGTKAAATQNGGGGAQQGGTGECGGAKTNLISCDGTGITALGNVLKQVLQILTVMIGIIAVGGIAYGAIMYASAQDNSGQTQKAIEVIRNVLIGILLYGFMVVIINWLIPGSVFG